MRTSALSSALFCAALGNALVFDAAKATLAAALQDLAADGWSPKPTEAPQIPHELMRRDYQLPVLVAPDNNCGYFDKVYTSLYDCGSDATCKIFLSIFTSDTSTYGGVGCCNSATCGAYSQCVDYTAYFSQSSRCTSSHCTYCTDAFYPYCGRATFVGMNVQDFYCQSSSLSNVQSIYTSYSDAVSARVYTTSYTTIGAADSAPTDSAQTSSVDGSANSAAGSSAAASSAVSSSARSTGTSGTASAAGATSTSTTQTTSSGGLPLGAIVGAAVGGVVVLGLVIAGIVICVRRKKKSKAAQGYQPPPMTGNINENGNGPANGNNRESWAPAKGTPQTQAYEFHGSPPPQEQYSYAPSQYKGAPPPLYTSPQSENAQPYFPQNQYQGPAPNGYQLAPQSSHNGSPTLTNVSMNGSQHSAYPPPAAYPLVAEVDGSGRHMPQYAEFDGSNRTPRPGVYEIGG